jgi:hypothetical protein
MSNIFLLTSADAISNISFELDKLNSRFCVPVIPKRRRISATRPIASALGKGCQFMGFGWPIFRVRTLTHATPSCLGSRISRHGNLETEIASRRLYEDEAKKPGDEILG